MNAKAPIAAPPAEAPEVKETDLVYRFQISRRALPVEFKNLWQLVAKGPNDVEPIEHIDADTLETVISRIRNIFEVDGL